MIRKTIWIVLLGIVAISCGDPCDEGYTQHTNTDGSTYCLPDYIVGKTNDFNLGDTYHHDIYGIIILKDGIWENENNQIVNP